MDSLASLRAALAGRYAVEHELGQGGMAVVYLARDVRHGRRVAIKVLRPDLGSALAAAERFLREIRVAAQLQHPHVLPLYDSGEADGHLYYVMPYVEGESLRQRLEREGPLPVGEAVRLAAEVADGLSYAHERGVVHRDIKPENILLSGGHALIADFGIARAADVAGLRLTETGMAVGTPVYMSPEQAVAGKVDGRSDLYALGCVLYEMLAGQPPFTGPTSQAVMARHTADAVPPLSTVRPVAPALEAAVVKALAKLPADRWPTGRAFAEALGATAGATPAVPRWRRAPLLVGMAAVLLGAGFWLSVTRALSHGATGPSDSLASVAVLPFRVIGDTSRGYVGFGLSEAVVTALVRVEGLRVPNLSSATARPVADPLEAGRRLHVATVLTGSVQIAGQRLKVAARLVRVADGVNIWADDYNGEMKDIFAMQDSIAERIVDTLRIRLTPSVRAAVARGVRTHDQVAYDLYLQARRATYRITPQSVERGISLLTQALQRDSTFADAWVALAEAYYFYNGTNLTAAEIAARWRRAAERAIALDSTSGSAYAVRAQLRRQYDWDFEGARSDLRRAVRLSPASAVVAQFYSWSAFEPESAVYWGRRALALGDPNDPFQVADLGFRFRYAGMLDSVLTYAAKALAIDSTTWIAEFLLGYAHARLGRADSAVVHTERLLRLTGDADATGLTWAAYVFGLAGRADRAREIVRRLEGLSRRAPASAGSLAVARLAAGDRAGALDALEIGVRGHDLNPTDFEMLVVLSGEPRYEAARRAVFGSDQREPGARR